MTVSSTTNKISYNCNGSTSVFAYTFKILNDADILVQIRTTSTGVLTTLVKITDYTVSGVNVSTGGNITLVSPSTSAPTGTTIILTRNMTETQETDYTEYDTFPASSHETALDRLTMLTQQIQEQLDRSLKLDSGVSGVTAQFVGTPAAGQMPLVNPAGTGFIFGNLSAIPAYNFPVGTGILVQSTTSTAITRSIAGTANEITATNGSGVSGNPTLSLPAALVFTGKTVTGGTFSSNTFTGALFTTAAAFSQNCLFLAPTSGSGALVLNSAESLSGNRVLSITTGDAARSLTLSGNFTVSGTSTINGTFSGTFSGTSSGTNTGDQTNITGNAATVTTNANLTGDVTSVGNATTYAGILPKAKGGSGFANNKALVDFQFVALSGSGTSSIPNDNTIPQNTEGSQVGTLSITPKNSANLLVHRLAGSIGCQAAASVTISVFQDSTANAIFSTGAVFTASQDKNFSVSYVMTAGTTSSTTFNVRAGTTAGTWTIGNTGAGTTLGGTRTAHFTVEEIG